MPTPKSKPSNGGARAAVVETSADSANPERERVFNAFRQWGYLEGDLDPLGFLRPRVAPELRLEGEYAREARAIYSSASKSTTSTLPTAASGFISRWNPSRRRKTSSAFSTC